MKCTIPEISWHNRDPVLSVDLQPKVDKSEDFYRLASGGTDSHVLIWFLTLGSEENDHINLELAADLARHQRAVNAVRWSPSGELLASGDDESVIFIWKKKGVNEVVNILDSTNDQDKEFWLTLKILRGHMEDVYDLSWSPDSLQLLSGSVDNTAMIWNVETGKSKGILGDHKGFVQGVGWDPANKYLATLSTDRNFRVFDVETRRVLSRSSKSLLPVPEDSPYHGKITRLYHDDTLQTFFRRLSFSPDSELIVTPSGVCEQDQNISSKPLNMSYIYSRNHLKQPLVVLPSPDQYTVCVKFCPLLFQLKKFTEEKNPPLIPLPYRMIFAVATKSCVFLYDTQQAVPFGIVSNIHYTRLTDLTWSNDGRVLVVSSTDGFCSVITFSENELGEIYDDTEVKKKLQEVTKSTKKKKRGRKSKKGQQKENELKAEEKSFTPIPETILKDTEILSKIIKSDEKFSPEKKDRPLTPIAIRRHPRVVEDSPNKVEHPKGKTPKKPTPIAVRRQPRTLNLAERNEVPMDEEEAVDAWPIGTDQPKLEKAPAVEKIVCDGNMENTVDLKLVMEVDSQMEDDEMLAEVDDIKKTPRRVPLITISTPKSKKKNDTLSI